MNSTSLKIIIRRYLKNDYAEVHRLNYLALLDKVEINPEHKNHFPDLDDIFNIYINNCGEFIVMLLADKIIAMGGLLKVDKNTAKIRRMRVHPAYQRNGYGYQILKYLEQQARKMGYSRLILNTSKQLIAAQRFYESNYFIKLPEIKHENLVFYEKILTL